MRDDLRRMLQQELIDFFDGWNLDVGVGLTKKGIAIRSQTDLVDAQNVGYPVAFESSIDITDCIQGDTLTLTVSEDGELEVADLILPYHDGGPFRECGPDYCGGGSEQCCCECAGCDEQPWYPW
jgi:hypothetical protein